MFGCDVIGAATHERLVYFAAVEEDGLAVVLVCILKRKIEIVRTFLKLLLVSKRLSNSSFAQQNIRSWFIRFLW